MRVGQAAVGEAALLRELAPDVACLQEVSANAIRVLRSEAGFAWLIAGRPAEGSTVSGRRSSYLTAVAGNDRFTATALPALEVPFPERTVTALVTFEARDMVVSSYHAPPGASWGILKVEQARAFAEWLAQHPGPVLFGADANTPALDALDFEMTRTHWHTGRPKLRLDLGVRRLCSH